MTYITFNDGEGTMYLRSQWASPANRFANWTPENYRPVGATDEAGVTLANETVHVFTVRTDHGASFDMPGLAAGAEADGPLDLADRLVAHLLNGGTCAVYTEDNDAASYTNCGLRPGTSPEIRQTDARAIEYTLSLSLLNLAGAAMTCHYADA